MTPIVCLFGLLFLSQSAQLSAALQKRNISDIEGATKVVDVLHDHNLVPDSNGASAARCESIHNLMGCHFKTFLRCLEAFPSVLGGKS